MRQYKKVVDHIMKKQLVPCPLGTDCPYAKGNKIPNHYTTSATYKLHMSFVDQAKKTGASAADIAKDFMDKKQANIDKNNNYKVSEKTGARVYPDGSVSFMGIGKGKKWREASKEINAAMSQELKSKVRNIVLDKDELLHYVSFVMNNYQLSHNNQLLIQLQNKSGNVFHTSAQWEAMGYKVQPGARQAMVRRPLFGKRDALDDKGHPKKDRDGEPIKESYLIGYSFYGVFSDRDLDSTVKELPQHPLVKHFEANKHRTDITAPVALSQDITQVATQLGIDIRYVDKNEYSTIAGGAAGFCRNEGDKKVIYIDKTMADHAQSSTLAHEMGHILSGHLDDTEDRTYSTNYHRGEMEAEAEIFAYALTKDYDFDISEKTAEYLYSWGSKANEEMIDKALEKTGKAMSTYYETLDLLVNSGHTAKDAIDQANEKVKENYSKRTSSR